MLSQNRFSFRSFTVLLTILLALPPASWITCSRGWHARAHTSGVAFQLPPFAVGNGLNPVQRILAATCDGRSGVYTADLEQLEVDAVTDYLKLHGLPLSDYATLYAYGRSDLRTEIRGMMLAALLGIAARAPSGNTG